MNNMFKNSTTTYNNKMYFIIKYAEIVVHVGYLSKIILNLTFEMVRRLGYEFKGEIFFIEGHDIIIFPTEQDASNATDYLNSLIIMEKINQ